MTLNLCLLPLGSRLRTRDGRSARLDANDRSGAYPIEVTIFADDLRIGQALMADGRQDAVRDFGWDIVSVEDTGDA